MAHWTLDDIDWHRFDPAQVDVPTVQIIKAAALVEHNGHDYARYLRIVFAGDHAFAEAALLWAEEEVQHGKALARWAMLADPTWDFAAAFARFTDGYQIPQAAAAGVSVRGSRSGELVARCIVESGTSSLYTALADSTNEPVLKQICRKIAADEFRHYKMFYDRLNDYLAQEGIGRARRLAIALSRVGETEDDELAFAFYCANTPQEHPYNLQEANASSVRRVYGRYRRFHVERAVAMILKATGLAPHGMMNRIATDLLYGLMQRRLRRLGRSPDLLAAA